MHGSCNSFAFIPDDPAKCSASPNKIDGCEGMCAAHDESYVDDLIRKNCRVVSGRVDASRMDGDKYDSCRFFYNNNLGNLNGCRV